MANEDRIEMVILPTGMMSAMIRLFTSMSATAALEPLVEPAVSTCR